MTIAFDTMWGVMLALKESSKELPNSMPLEQNVKRFLGNARITKTIELKLRNVSFEGLTGPVSFTKNEERSGIVIIRQYQADRTALVPIGEYHIIQDKFVVYDEFKDTLWKDNHQPMDHSQRELEFMKIQVPLIAAMWGFAAIGIACSSGFLCFNIGNRKKSVIKMSSPNLNSIIVMGCMLCYAAVILIGLDVRFLYVEEYTFVCNARSAVLCIGYSLSFGAMFSKTWRVHKIFTAGLSRDKMAIKDSHLLVTIAALLMIDVVFLSFWILTDPLQAKILTFEERASLENHIVTIPALYQCTCRYKTYFLAFVFTYKGLLLLFGIFLAWETRNVSIPALNDSKYIGMSVYNVFVLSIIGASVSLAFQGSVHYEAPYAILSICLIMSTSVTLLLVFVPKIYQFRTKVNEATQSIRVRELMEGQIFNSICRATQTDLGVSELKAEANEAFSSSEEIPQEASDEKNGCGIQPVKLISERSTGQKDKAAKTPGPVTSQH
ncbi:gamma-aminobutyric acid type B receptor subunit 2-like [Pocillopora verrucosa]|uniref:gamma-aminobutyric acid type B receptor subunit 2-like n=1 Tax=Pocillopora verrucosa TaxID=203993 RepID=UPI00333E908A